jgi:hypothetical protein
VGGQWSSSGRPGSVLMHSALLVVLCMMLHLALLILCKLACC